MSERRPLTDEEFDEHRKRADRRVEDVFVFANGMCAVMDQFGVQMPELQGPWAEKRAAIEAAAGKDVAWHFPVPVASFPVCGDVEAHVAVVRCDCGRYRQHDRPHGYRAENGAVS